MSNISLLTMNRNYFLHQLWTIIIILMFTNMFILVYAFLLVVRLYNHQLIYPCALPFRLTRKPESPKAPRDNGHVKAGEGFFGVTVFHDIDDADHGRYISDLNPLQCAERSLPWPSSTNRSLNMTVTNTSQPHGQPRAQPSNQQRSSPWHDIPGSAVLNITNYKGIWGSTPPLTRTLLRLKPGRASTLAGLVQAGTYEP